MSNTDIGSLYTRIEADTSGLNEAEKSIKGFAKKASIALGAISVAFAAVAIKRTTNAAARYEELGVVMHQVGKNAGYTADQMDKVEEAVKSTGISMLKSRAAISKMTAANIDLSKASELARIAQDAAVIGNIDSSEAFDRMIEGIQRGQSLILKNIGITVNFGKVYRDAAKSLGKTVKELTEHEKMTARTNAVLAQGASIAGVYEKAMGTVGKKVRSLKRPLSDLSVRLGAVFIPTYNEIINRITESLKKFNASLNDDEIKEWGEEIRKNFIEVEKLAYKLALGLDKIGGSFTQMAALLFAPGMMIGNENSTKQFDKFMAMNDEYAKKYKESSEALNKLIESETKRAAAALTGPLVKANEDVAKSTEESTKKQAKSLAALQTTYEKHKEAILAIQEDIRSSQLDYAEEEIQLQIDIVGDEKGRKLILDQVEEIKRQAAVAGESGTGGWQTQVKLLERAKDLIMSMSTEGKTISDKEVAAAKNLYLLAKRRVERQSTSGTRSAAQQALEDYRKLAKAQKQGPNEVEKQKKLKEKLNEVKAINQQILEIKKQVEETSKKEANAIITESQFQVADKLFETIKEKTKEITDVSLPTMSDVLNMVWVNAEEKVQTFYTSVEEASKSTTNAKIGDIENWGKEIKKVEGVYTNVFVEAVKASSSATSKILSDIGRVESALKKTESQQASQKDSMGVPHNSLSMEGRTITAPVLSGAKATNLSAPLPTVGGAESSRTYHISGEAAPIRVKATDSDANRLLSVLKNKYKSRSGN